MKKVLIGSPIRQDHVVLNEFLVSLSELNKANIEVDYFFVDDNVDTDSSQLLKNFAKKNNVVLKKGSDFNHNVKDSYVANKSTHLWKDSLIRKITMFKDSIIEYAKHEKYEYLFFVDSDIVLHVETLRHLISRNVDVVSNIFWTQFNAGCELEPQVWQQNVYDRFKKPWDRDLNEYEKYKLTNGFIAKLRIPGIYEVGGLGACTLLSNHALKSGVKFELIDNVSFWGEDRHFCIRAQAIGLKLYVDTVYPAYHIYRPEYLDRVDEFKKDGFKFDMCQTNKIYDNRLKFKNRLFNTIKKLLKYYRHKVIIQKINKWSKNRVIENKKIVLSMIVHNECGRYLDQLLENAKKFVDDILIIDDASTDNTFQLCEEILKGFPHTIIKNKKSMFKHEYRLRMKQWKETLKLNPGWILSLDADEILEDSFKDIVKYLISVDDIDVYNFRLFDMWNEKQYREDEYWDAHNRHMTFMLRYQPKFKYKFKKTNQHCGRLPCNLFKLKNADIDVRIKHFGWARESDRKAKYDRYKQLDKGAKCGNAGQYESILDQNPNLINFNE